MLEDNWKKLIKTTVSKHLPPGDFKIFIFGSRAKDGGRKWSDVDVGVTGTSSLKGMELEYAKEELEQSDIPYRIDLVDFNKFSARFKTVAMESVVYL